LVLALLLADANERADIESILDSIQIG
jgi:hypothetical protein